MYAEIQDDCNELDGSEPSGVACPRVLMLVQGANRDESLTAWLNDKFPSGAELRLLDAVEPKWFTDIPDSALKAKFMVDEHYRLLWQKEQQLSGAVAAMSERFKRIKFSWQVISGRLSAAKIMESAKAWGAGVIVVLPETSEAKRLANSLKEQIKRQTSCAVQLLQA